MSVWRERSSHQIAAYRLRRAYLEKILQSRRRKLVLHLPLGALHVDAVSIHLHLTPGRVRQKHEAKRERARRRRRRKRQAAHGC